MLTVVSAACSRNIGTSLSVWDYSIRKTPEIALGGRRLVGVHDAENVRLRLQLPNLLLEPERRDEFVEQVPNVLGKMPADAPKRTGKHFPEIVPVAGAPGLAQAQAFLVALVAGANERFRTLVAL